MVFPKEPDLITMEKLLTKRIDKLFEAMDNAIGDLFDDITDEIEMLLKLAPPIYEELMKEKQVLLKEMDNAVNAINQISELARDDIYKQRFVVGETASVEWDFRKDYTQAILSLMGKYQLMPYESPFIGEMNSVQFVDQGSMEEQEEVQPPEEEISQEVEQPPQTVQEPVQQQPPPEPVQPPPEPVQKKRKFEV